jgi:Ni,Fe-hydrogenase III small subunit
MLPLIHPHAFDVGRFVTCPNGIEIFNSIAGPTGPPEKVAPFGKTKAGNPYLDPKAVLAAIEKVIAAHPAPFSNEEGDSSIGVWKEWAANCPPHHPW